MVDPDVRATDIYSFLDSGRRVNFGAQTQLQQLCAIKHAIALSFSSALYVSCLTKCPLQRTLTVSWTLLDAPSKRPNQGIPG